MKNQEKQAFISRHTEKVKDKKIESKQYPGITEKGVDIAKERAKKEILELIEQSEPGSVIFIGGATEQVRTKSTAEVYGDELKEALKNREDEFLVIIRKDIQEKAKEKGYTKTVEQIVEALNANQDKKVIIDFPMFLKDFSMERLGWVDKQGNLTQYADKLLKRNNDDDYASAKDWIENKGKMGDLEGPDPEEAAKGYKRAIERLEEFAKKYIGDRPLVIGMVGHSWDIEAYMTYLLNHGRVDVEGFEKIAKGRIIGDAELTKIKISPIMTTVSYRGEDFVVK
ncbi:hypothetical protein KKG58_00690 [Patescibacteria group bacterium]|nr:hypothetical protein [Patescibacteria group bacterium]